MLSLEGLKLALLSASTFYGLKSCIVDLSFKDSYKNFWFGIGLYLQVIEQRRVITI